jgi:putative ATPase
VVSSVDSNEIIITNDLVVEKAQQNIVRYDKNGEQHYDIISAFIKSIRGSDPNAAVYWLLILASEDIGNANPTALVITNNCFQAVNVIGFPEARITLSQAVIYLACSPKSNSAYMAINEAQAEVRSSGDLTIPLHLRNAPTKLMKELGYGKDYLYSHNKPTNSQEFLPEEITGNSFYKPGNNSKENTFKEGLKNLWQGKYKY